MRLVWDVSAALIAASCIAGMVNPASAITFTTSSVSVSDSINGPNVDYTSGGLNSDLTIGTPFTISNFIVAGVNGSSFSAQTGTISATLNFSAPPGASGNVDSGTIAASLVQTDKHISITWADPITILFSNGTQLRVDLGNVDFNCGTSCNQDEFNIAGTFTALNGPTGVESNLVATPIPGALPLFASGGSLLAFLGWRRKRKLAATAA
jgi:hypothetical protein